MSRTRFSITKHTNFRVWQESQPSVSNQQRQPPSRRRLHFLDGFPIEFRTRKLVKTEKYVGNCPEPVDSYQRAYSWSKSVWLPRHQVLLHDNGARLLSLLRDLDTQLENPAAVSRNIARVAASAKSSRMPIVVKLLITVKVTRIDDYEFSSQHVLDDTVILNSIETYEFKPVPATNSSIENLDKVRFQLGSKLVRECIICMEEFQTGSEVTRMPCSHVYHGECIFKWLKTSHLCPLCRYPMPHDC